MMVKQKEPVPVVLLNQGVHVDQEFLEVRSHPGK